MSNTQTLESHAHVNTGLSDSTDSSSSSSAERYKLDEFDSRPILLYKYRGRLQMSSQKDLCAWLDKDEKWRVTRKHIPRYTSYIDIIRHDLFLPDEKEAYKGYPNYYSNLASVKIPSWPYWNRLILGGYDELYIVSPESSPSSSVIDEDSRKSSPTTTWTRDRELDAKLGAVKEQRDRESEDQRGSKG